MFSLISFCLGSLCIFKIFNPASLSGPVDSFGMSRSQFLYDMYTINYSIIGVTIEMYYVIMPSLLANVSL